MKESLDKNDIHLSSNYPDDNFISDDELDDLSKLDQDRAVIMNMAGPLNAKKAIDRMHRIMGDKDKKHPLKPKYIRQEILDQIKELEEQFEKERLFSEESENESQQEATGDADESDSENLQARFYNRAKSSVERLSAERSLISKKITRNFKIFSVVATLFAVYFVYMVFSRDDDSLAVAGIKNRLPLTLDENTTLNAIDIDEKTFFLDITVKESVIFNAENQNNALDLYIKKTSDKFCKISIFSDMIKSGKIISVVLNAENGSFSKSFTVDNCEKLPDIKSQIIRED